MEETSAGSRWWEGKDARQRSLVAGKRSREDRSVVSVDTDPDPDPAALSVDTDPAAVSVDTDSSRVRVLFTIHVCNLEVED